MNDLPTFRRVVRRRHHVYTHREIDSVLYFVGQPRIPRGALAKIARDTGIPNQTLSDWRIHRIEPGGKNWFPLEKGHPNMRIFSEEVETHISQCILENYIDTGIGATPNDVAMLAKNAFSSLDVSDMHVERFCASRHFISNFMDRNNFSLRRPHNEKRTSIDSNYEQEFLKRFNEIWNDYPPECILNFDETCWRIYEGQRQVIAEKGCETVKVDVNTNEK